MKKNNIPEILVVDDDLEAAQNFAEYIKVRLKIPTIAESDLKEAFHVVQQGTIKVVVLDQKMKESSGTDLYKKIHQFNPYIKAIMLTGEADRNEVAEAMTMGYVGYLDKNNIQQLPNTVIVAYTKYQIDLCSNSNDMDPIPIKVWNPLKSFVRYEICSIKTLNSEYIFEDKWKTVLELEAAEKEVEEVCELTKEVIIQKDTTESDKLTVSLPSIDISGIKSEIDVAVTKYLGETHKWNFKKNKKIKNVYRLQDGVEEGKKAIKKVYERNQIYVQYHIMLKMICRFCEKVQLIPFFMYRPVPKEKTRVRIYYSDGSNQYIDTEVVSITGNHT